MSREQTSASPACCARAGKLSHSCLGILVVQLVTELAAGENKSHVTESSDRSSFDVLLVGLACF